MRLFFTADHHFGHANIIKYCQRPFATVAEMDAALIRHCNSTVGADDVVYHLGDFTLQGLPRFTATVQQLNGRLKILPGSHDRRWLESFQADDPELHTASGHSVELLPPLVSLEVPELGNGRHPQVIVLCHYARRVWDKSHYGAWHVYGHSHGSLPGFGLSFDIGVDYNAFRPFSLSSHDEWCSPPRMKMCYNQGCATDAEVVLQSGATSLFSSRTRIPAGTANCRHPHPVSTQVRF